MTHPFRQVPQRVHVNGGLQFAVVCFGLSVAAVLMFAALLALFLFYPTRPALADPIKPPRDCVKLAAMFGATTPETFSRAEAKAALAQLNVRMILVPEARNCRAAIEKELKK